MQIALDTSTDIAGIAIVEGQEIIAELAWRCGMNHTIESYPRLEMLLEKTGRDIQTATCVYVAKGPGSFNGLRVGVSAAKGLAFSLGIPIIGISTLESSAYQHAESGLPVCAIQNAGREEIAVAIFQKKARKGWTPLSEEHLTTLKELNEQIKQTTIFCGDFNAETELQIKKLFKARAIISSPASRLRRAAFLAELGYKRAAAGSYDNLATLQPTYLRKPPITERKKA